MAEESTVPETESTAETGEPRRNILGHVKIIAFVATVVAAETLVAYLLIPSAADTTAMAIALEDPKQRPTAEDVPELPLEQVAGLENGVEFDLGEFMITLAQPDKNRTLHIDFHLYGTVPADEQHEMEARYTKFQQRIVEQVEIIVRSADEADLTDPGLSLIKRKILDKTNRILGKQYFQDVHLNKYSFAES